MGKQTPPSELSNEFIGFMRAMLQDWWASPVYTATGSPAEIVASWIPSVYKPRDAC